MKTELARRMIALADTLEPLTNDVAQIHHDLRQEGVWGTGVTAPLERKLSEISASLRDLVNADQQRIA